MTDAVLITDEMIQKARKAMKKLREEHTPLEGNICHHDGGKVVRRVSSFFRGQYHYSLPACEKCGRVYLYAENTATRGEREFEKALHQRITF